MNLASRIEHTLLAPDASTFAIERLCAEAVEHGFFGVCVHPVHVRRAAELLAGKVPSVVTVVGFPTGASFTEAKVLETACAVSDGADEIDMVMRIGALKEGSESEVEHDVAAVVRAAGSRPVKVIIETGLLSHGDIAFACSVCMRAGAQFVKTSTGFFGTGATVEGVRIMRSVVRSSLRIKASGGIKTREQARQLIDAGADRIGCSASLAIIGVNT